MDSLYNDLKALLESYHPKGSTGPKPFDEYAPVIQPKIVCTNCCQEFYPKQDTEFMKKDKVNIAEDIPDYNINSTKDLDVAGHSRWPKKLEAATKSIGLFHEIYMNKFYTQ